MEYLHRVLQGLVKNLNFKFHPKCDRLKIINLCFADDILLFAREDHESMRLIIDKMREFSTTTSLTIRIPKRKIYFGGVDEESKKIIQQPIGFAVGTLLVKYLGAALAREKK
ncbi:unnamed protein product [Lathyrus sativus]|nr:unnamed protein product [Lathyrus sativus]